MGKTIADVAGMRKESPSDTIFRLFKDHIMGMVSGKLKGRFSFVNFNQSLDNVHLFIKTPWVAVGSDGSVHAPYGVLLKHILAPHARYYGTFPRVLGLFAREQGVISISEGIRKMTSLPARILGLHDRGIIAPGMLADLVVFDPDMVRDGSDFLPPEATMRFPVGIDHLVVNGVFTLRDGEHTGAMAGKVLRKR